MVLRQDGRTLGEARLSALHPSLDLAILLADRDEGPFARFAADPNQTGGLRLSAVGYPSEGVARIEASLAPVVAQPEMVGRRSSYYGFLGRVRRGNSGSPLLDEWGRVIGVVTAKLDSVAIYAKTGKLPPDAGFAVSHASVVAFLQDKGIRIATEPPGRELEDEAILEKARRFVVRVDCWH